MAPTRHHVAVGPGGCKTRQALDRFSVAVRRRRRGAGRWRAGCRPSIDLEDGPGDRFAPHRRTFGHRVEEIRVLQQPVRRRRLAVVRTRHGRGRQGNGRCPEDDFLYDAESAERSSIPSPACRAYDAWRLQRGLDPNGVLVGAASWTVLGTGMVILIVIAASNRSLRHELNTRSSTSKRTSCGSMGISSGWNWRCESGSHGWKGSLRMRESIVERATR